MADTMSQSADQSRSATVRSSSAAIGVLVLALAPQLFELLWSLAALIFRVFSSPRNPAQAMVDHLYALAWAVPSWMFGSVGTNGKAVALSSDILLALIYSYPLLAIAVLTFFVRPRSPQDYFGGVVLVALSLFALICHLVCNRRGGREPLTLSRLLLIVFLFLTPYWGVFYFRFGIINGFIVVNLAFVLLVRLLQGTPKTARRLARTARSQPRLPTIEVPSK